MSSDLLSRNLDTIPITTEELNSKTCTHSWVFITHRAGDPHTIIGNEGKFNECDKPATHIVLRTCCGGITYRCTEHAEPFGKAPGSTCLECKHRCIKGVCCHRVVTPL